MGNSRHHSGNSEYMNLDVGPSSAGYEGYVVMRPDSVHEASDNYVNLDPTTGDKSALPAKKGDKFGDSYVNLDPTTPNFGNKLEDDNYVNIDPNSQPTKSRIQSGVYQKPALCNKDDENSSNNFDSVSQAVEKKSESYLTDNYVNINPTTTTTTTTTQNGRIQDSDSQYANLDYTSKTSLRRYYSSPATHKRVPSTSTDEELPHPPCAQIVFHHFPSDESLNSKPANENAISESEPKNDDLTDYTAHPVTNSEEATRPQQQFDPSQTSEYENLIPINQISTADPQESRMTPQESEYELMTLQGSRCVMMTPQESEYEVMTCIGHHAAQCEQSVSNVSKHQGYEDFVPIKTNGNSCSNQTNHDTCVNGAYSLLQFQTESSIPTKPIQDGSSSYSLLSHSQKVVGSASSSSNYSKLEVSGTHESSKTGQLPNQDKPVLPPRNPEKPLVPPRELKKRIQQPEPSSLFSGYPELPPRNPSFQGVIHSPTKPPVLLAGPKPTSHPQSVINLSPSNQSSSSLNYCEVVVLPAEIGQPKFRPRSAAIDQTMPAQKSTDNYAMIDAAASLGLQKALQQQEHDRLA